MIDKMKVLLSCIPESPFRAQLTEEVAKITSERDRLHDALDHIRRVCNRSREQSRRTRWISYRCDGAINNTEEWKNISLPKNGETIRRKLQAEISELKQPVFTDEENNRILDSLRDLSKWVNEKPNREVDVQSLCTVMNALRKHRGE